VNKTTALIQGLLHTAFYELALDEDDRAANYERLAQKIWNRYQAEIQGAEKRVGLKPMPELKRVVREQIFSPESRFSPAMQDILRTKLGISAPASTNAPPVEATSK
jgi:hypothetical protein